MTDLNDLVDFKVTDVALCARNIHKSICYPGPILLPGRFHDYCIALLKCCEEFKAAHPGLEDYTVEHGDLVWRVHHDPHVIDGDWYRLRRMPAKAPHLGEDGLPSKLPAAMTNALLHTDLQRGGLVLVVGGPGAGKTTTASATVVSRLQTYGGVAYTVENPPEQPLNGWHLHGYCHQTQISQGDESGWATSMIGVLRSQPSKTPCILFVGEIRTSQAAEVALQAAANGFLVIATGFGSDIVSGVEGFLKMVGLNRAMMLGQLLRVVVYQRFLDKMLQVQILVSASPSSRTATIISGGQITRLVDEVQFQANTVRSGGDLWK